MNEMIERVAKAIVKSYLKSEVPEASNEDIDKAVNRCYHEWIVHAKDAIQAMRDPTQDMINAYYDSNYGDPVPGWQTMIDEALKGFNMIKTFVITSNHKLHDHGDMQSFIKAETEEEAKEKFKILNPQFELIEIEEYDDD